MLKQVILAGALVASPAWAQSTAAPTQDSPAAVSTDAEIAVPAQDALPRPLAEPQSAPAIDGTTRLQRPTPARDAPAQAPVAEPTPQGSTPAQTGAQPIATGEQVAQIVRAEFPAYDKDGDGKLDTAEFNTWMVALKTASDPSTQADSAATRSWIGAAFVQADKDESSTVTEAELTGFLSQGAS